MRNFKLLLGLLLSGIYLQSSQLNADDRSLTIYVSPDGDDTADGSEPHPNTQGGKGPVRTVDRAKMLMRQARGQQSTNVEKNIVLRGGRYQLDRPLTFDPEDSGHPDAPVTYRSYPGELARIDGGRRIRDWRRVEGDIWSAPYRDPSSPNGCPSQLFINGERRPRPRLPTAGTFRIERVAEKAAGIPQLNDRFYAKLSDLPQHIETNDDTEVVIFDAWTASRMRLKSYDSASGLLSLSGRFAGHGHHPDMTPGLPYYIENFKDGPSAEKTWQCDARSGEIRYHAGSEESFEAADVVVPYLDKLVVLQGRSDEYVHDIRFEDIYFEMTSWHLPATGWAAMQAEVGLSAAIEMRNAHAITFSRFALVRTGANGIGIHENCFDISISGGELRDLGGTAIAIGSDQRKPIPGTAWSQGETSFARTHDVAVRDTLIASAGRIHWAAVGVWIGQADHIAVERNEIRDLYYSGISIGWTWEFGESLSHNNKIVGNVIKGYGQGVLSDLGGVYTLGRQNNSVVADNIILDGKARTYGGHGLYGDAGTAGFVFRNNVVAGVSHAGIHIHYGSDLTFDGNALFNYREAGIRCTRKSRGVSVVFKNNLLQSNDTPPFFGVCGDPSYVFENNLLRDGSGQSLLFEKSASQMVVVMAPVNAAAPGVSPHPGNDPHVRQFARDAREAIAAASNHAGRLTDIRLTQDMRDGPPAIP